MQQPHPQQAFIAQQLQQPTTATGGASQWTASGLYNPMAGLPSWDLQSQASAFSTASLNQQPSSDWYFNSGATSHMTSTPHILSHASSTWYHAPSSIVVGNASIIPVTATSSTELFPYLHLNNVLVSL